MAEKNIEFFEEGVSYTLKQKNKIRKWIEQAISSEGFESIGELNYIFCSDDYLLVLNKQYLSHDTYTDVVTFDTSVEENEIAGDIFISIERIRENAKLFGNKIEEELHRVMIHGILHLCGYEDETEYDKKKMTEREDYYLNILKDS